MKDRFLFRVWNEKWKTYDNFPYGEIALTESGEMFWIENSSDCSEANEEYFTVEQCTGLKDKDGKLVFEGDVVFVNGEKWRVIWSDEDCAFFFSNLKEEYYQPILPDLHMMTADFKVIGNVHENEELLK